MGYINDNQSYKRKKTHALIATIISFACVIVFREFVISKFNFIFVDPFISKTTTGVYSDVCLVSILAIAVYSYLISAKRQIAIQFNILLFTSFYLALYLLSRWSNEWTFYAFSKMPFVYYADSIALFAIVLIGKQLKIINGRSIKSNNNNRFLIDTPSNKDDYSRKQYAIKIVDKLKNTYSSSNIDAFSIGICGTWGSGKTSFLLLMKEEMRTTKVIFFDYNVWLCRSPNEIVIEFFKRLNEELTPLNPNIKSNATKYLDALIEIDGSNAVKALKYMLEKTASATKEYEGLKYEIKKLNVPIFVFIDDLDRLDAGEIIETLRLIRNTANFPNLFFIATYDKDYVVNALENNGFHKPEQYLEKIFNIEIILPTFEPDVIIHKLVKLIEKAALNHKFEQNDIDQSINYLTNKDEYVYKHKILHAIKSMRDVKRFTNGLSLSIESLKENSSIKDFCLRDIIILEIIKYSHTKYYNILRETPSMLLELRNSHYALKEDIDSLLTASDLIRAVLHKRDQKTIVADSVWKAANDKTEKSTICNLIPSSIETEERIVGTLLSNLVDNATDPRSISCPINYYRYFAYRLKEGNIPFNKFLSGVSSENYSAYLDELRDSKEDNKESLLFNIKRIVGEDLIPFSRRIEIILYYSEEIYTHAIYMHPFSCRFKRADSAMTNLLSGAISGLLFNREKRGLEENKRLTTNSQNRNDTISIIHKEGFIYSKIAFILNIPSEESIISQSDQAELLNSLYDRMLVDTCSEIDISTLYAIQKVYSEIKDKEEETLRLKTLEIISKNTVPWFSACLVANNTSCLIDWGVIQLLWKNKELFEEWLTKIDDVHNFNELYKMLKVKDGTVEKENITVFKPKERAL